MSDHDLAERLSTIDLFYGVPRKALQRLARNAKEVQHPDGRVVVEEGGKALGFHLIIDGEAEVDNPDKSILKAGDYFGEISLIDGLPRSVSVTAKRGMRTVYLNSSTFDALLRDYPETARSVMKVLTKRIRDLESKARAQSG